MPRQDYVSHSPKSKKSPYKAQKSEPIFTLKLKLIILLLLVVVGGFAYFLWTIKNTTPVPVQPTNKVTVPQATHDDLPTPHVEKWGYMDDLKNKKVPESTYDVEKKGPYKMQCGSFRTREQAETLKANIAFTGLTAQIKAVNGSTGTWYKVYLGPYERKRAAEADKKLLKRNNINYCQIWLW